MAPFRVYHVAKHCPFFYSGCVFCSFFVYNQISIINSIFSSTNCWLISILFCLEKKWKNTDVTKHNKRVLSNSL